MPLTTTGENYRTFSEPRFFECVLESQIQLIEYPVDKSHAIVAPADGSSYAMWKFDSASNAAPGASVIAPTNPLFATYGRWIKLPAAGGGAASFLSGHGSPNGVTTGVIQGQTYLDLDSGGLYAFAGTVGTNTGWV